MIQGWIDTLGGDRILVRSPVTVASLIDGRTVGGLQYRAFVLSALSLVVEGYDTQAGAYIAATVSKNWCMTMGALGPVFAAGFIGSALGSIALAPLSDRVGRKRVMVASALAVGILSLLC